MFIYRGRGMDTARCLSLFILPPLRSTRMGHWNQGVEFLDST